MYGADEKKAFEDMLAEIGDDSDDDNFGYSAKGGAKPTSRAVAESKASQVSSAYTAGAKSSSSSSTANYSTYQRSQSAQMSKQEEEIERFGSDTANSAAQLQSEQINATKRWLTRSCSAGDKNTMKCFVERERSTFGMQTTYRCYLEGPGSGNSNISSSGGALSAGSSVGGAEGAAASGARFLMSAKKRVVNKTSYYLISLDFDAADDRGSESVLGKVRGNAIGSRYLLTDHGLAPEKAVAPSMLRKELGVVSFEFDSGGPSRIEAWVPAVSNSNVAAVWQPDSEAAGMEAQIDENRLDRLVFLQNKAPKWDEAHGGHVLNFQGRVTESSVKNFQLCCASAEDPDQVVLQFGRVGKHKFNMDLRFPLSPMQAFSICVACLDGKIADRKGYEYLRKFASGASAEAAGEGGEGAVVGGEVAHNGVQAPIVRQGSMQGASSFSGMLREALPSKQYLKDKINRTFK